MPRKAAVHIVGSVRLIQRGRYWHVSYTTPAGRVRQSLQVTNLKVAQQKAREIDDLIEQGEYVTLEDRRQLRDMTYAEFVEEFTSKHKGWSPNTWLGVKSILKQHLAEWGSLPMSAFNPRMVETYLSRRIDQDGITNATANRHLTCLKTLFKMAMRWGVVAHNPVEKVKALKEAERVPNALSEDQVAALLEHLPGYARVIVIVAVDTGMRKGELFSLQWPDVDFEKKQITVRQSKNKTFRVIPMTHRVNEALQTQRQKGIIPYVLVGRDGKPDQCIRDIIKLGAKKAGIGHVHLHMFRHTFATRLRERGVALDRIMALMGHKTMTMTLRYARSSPVQLKDAIAALD